MEAFYDIDEKRANAADFADQRTSLILSLRSKPPQG
jgi:hypothetical protein